MLAFYTSKEAMQMLVTMKVILIMVILISFLGTIGTEDKNMRNNLTVICSVSIMSITFLLWIKYF